MKYGLMAANTMHYAAPAAAAELGRAAEKAGFDSLWTADHPVLPERYESAYPYDPSGKIPGSSGSPLPDSLVWLTWVAAHTETIKLGTGVLILPLRNPLVLAKELASLDVLSGGRMLLGIGVGWLEEEFEALGVPFGDRGRRTDEWVEVMRALWASDPASYSGKRMSFEDMRSNPKPINASVPVVVGGHSRKAAERAGRLGDGFFPLGGDLAELLDVVRQTAAGCGRDPEAIEVTATHDGIYGDDPQAAVAELEALGVQRVGLSVWRLGRGDIAERCSVWAEKLAIA